MFHLISVCYELAKYLLSSGDYGTTDRDGCAIDSAPGTCGALRHWGRNFLSYHIGGSPEPDIAAAVGPVEVPATEENAGVAGTGPFARGHGENI